MVLKHCLPFRHVKMTWPLLCLCMSCKKKTQKQSRTRTCYNKTQYAVQTKPKLYINTPLPQHPFLPPLPGQSNAKGSFSPEPTHLVKSSVQPSLALWWHLQSAASCWSCSTFDQFCKRRATPKASLEALTLLAGLKDLESWELTFQIN